MTEPHTTYLLAGQHITGNGLSRVPDGRSDVLVLPPSLGGDELLLTVTLPDSFDWFYGYMWATYYMEPSAESSPAPAVVPLPSAPAAPRAVIGSGEEISEGDFLNVLFHEDDDEFNSSEPVVSHVKSRLKLEVRSDTGVVKSEAVPCFATSYASAPAEGCSVTVPILGMQSFTIAVRRPSDMPADVPLTLHMSPLLVHGIAYRRIKAGLMVVLPWTVAPDSGCLNIGTSPEDAERQLEAHTFLPSSLVRSHKGCGLPLPATGFLPLSESGHQLAVVAPGAVAGKQIRVRWLHDEAGVWRTASLTLPQVRVPDSLFCQDLTRAPGVPTSLRADIAAAVAGSLELSAYLSARYAREAVALLFKSCRGSEANVGALGGCDNVVMFLKQLASLEDSALRPLCVASTLCGELFTDNLVEGGSLKIVQRTLADVLRGEQERCAAADSEDRLSNRLVQECIANFVGDAKTGVVGGPATRETPRGFPAVQATNTCSVHIAGATATRVEVDSSTSLSSGSLAFFANKDCTLPVAVYTSSWDSQRSFVTSYDTLWYKVVFPSGARLPATVSYKFTVTAVRGSWASSLAVTQESSMEWACWLLGLLLSKDVRPFLTRGAVHNAQICDALIKYLRTSVPPARTVVKHRVVTLLCQLLKSPDMFLPTSLPDVSGSWELPWAQQDCLPYVGCVCVCC